MDNPSRTELPNEEWTGPSAKDEATQRRYFTMIPNMVDDSDLSPHAVRLYLHIRRVAGEDGLCWQRTTRMAKACHMDARTVRKAEKELKAAGLIRIDQQRVQRLENHKVNVISVVDIWGDNESRYATEPAKAQRIEELCTEAV
jgi:hypothetical protein